MDAQAPMNQFSSRKGNLAQKRRDRRKQLQHSADIEFVKGPSLQSIPSLSKQLKTVTECVIGLQYVWEYRSPSKSVPPHYHCKLCGVSRLQHDMLAHVKGWKHSFRYMQKAHPDKVTQTEEEAVRDPAVRKAIKEAAAEVEKSEGRGQLKVILKEPCEVIAFKGLRSAIPKPRPLPPPTNMGPPFDGTQSCDTLVTDGKSQSNSSSDPMFPEARYSGEFPPGGPFSDYPEDDYGDPGFGGYQSEQDFPDSGMDQRPYQDDVGHYQDDVGHYPEEDSFGPSGGRDSNGRRGLLDEIPSRMYPDDFQRGQMGGGLMNRPMEKPLERPGLMGTDPESGNQSNTLLTYLDTFRIENESDAQLVLKVTQKLTDVLMEYRLRSVSKGPSLTSLPMSSNSFTPTPSRLPSTNGRYSSSLTGPPRYYK